MTLPFDFSGPVTIWIIGLLAAYTVGRVGIPTLYQDIKHFIQGVKGSVQGAKAAITASTTSTTSSSSTKAS